MYESKMFFLFSFITFYQADEDVFTIQNTTLPEPDTSHRIKGISLKECDQACLQIPGCKSYEYHEKYNYCDPSNKTHLTSELIPNKYGWDTHILNPGQWSILI